MYDIPLGLHTYLRNGGQSRLEIKVEFHEGAVPLSTLLALYGSHLAFSLVSLMCFISSYTELCCRAERGNFEGGRVSEGILC